MKNFLTVKQAGTKDVELKRAVEDVLPTVPVLYGADIYVTAKDGIVTLKGDVEKPRHSRAAEKAAEQVPGVIQVVNLLKVIGKPRPDREIEEDVVFYLQSSSLVNLDEFDYKVENGVVKLKGTIDNLSHKYALASDLEKIHGVKAVDVAEVRVKETASARARE